MLFIALQRRIEPSQQVVGEPLGGNWYGASQRITDQETSIPVFWPVCTDLSANDPKGVAACLDGLWRASKSCGNVID